MLRAHNESEEVLDYYEYSYEARVIIGTISSLLIIVAIIGNLSVIIIFYQNSKLRKRNSNYFLLNLAVLDLMVAIFIWPLSIFTKLNGKFVFSHYVCLLWLNADYLCTCGSLINLVLLSLDRYFTFLFAVHYHVGKKDKKTVLKLISLSWIIPSSTYIPLNMFGYFFMADQSVNDDKCEEKWASSQWMVISVNCLMSWIPLLSLIVLYSLVFYGITKTLRKANDAKVMYKQMSSSHNHSESIYDESDSENLGLNFYSTERDKSFDVYVSSELPSKTASGAYQSAIFADNENQFVQKVVKSQKLDYDRLTGIVTTEIKPSEMERLTKSISGELRRTVSLQMHKSDDRFHFVKVMKQNLLRGTSYEYMKERIFSANKLRSQKAQFESGKCFQSYKSIHSQDDSTMKNDELFRNLSSSRKQFRINQTSNSKLTLHPLIPEQEEQIQDFGNPASPTISVVFSLNNDQDDAGPTKDSLSSDLQTSNYNLKQNYRTDQKQQNLSSNQNSSNLFSSEEMEENLVMLDSYVRQVNIYNDLRWFSELNLHHIDHSSEVSIDHNTNNQYSDVSEVIQEELVENQNTRRDTYLSENSNSSFAQLKMEARNKRLNRRKGVSEGDAIQTFKKGRKYSLPVKSAHTLRSVKSKTQSSFQMSNFQQRTNFKFKGDSPSRNKIESKRLQSDKTEKNPIIAFFKVPSMSKQRKTAYILMPLVIAAVICWLPFSIMSSIKWPCASCVGDFTYNLSVWLVYTNSLINPFLYVFTNATFRRAAYSLYFENGLVRFLSFYWNGQCVPQRDNSDRYSKTHSQSIKGKQLEWREHQLRLNLKRNQINDFQ